MANWIIAGKGVRVMVVAGVFALVRIGARLWIITEHRVVADLRIIRYTSYRSVVKTIPVLVVMVGVPSVSYSPIRERPAVNQRVITPANTKVF